MVMHHPLKFSYKRTSSSVDMAETVTSDYMSPHFDLDLDPEDIQPIFSHNTMSHDDASLY